MSIKNHEFLLINEIDNIGNFYLHFGNEIDYPNKKGLRPAFKVFCGKENYFDLKTGFLSDNKDFYECPLTIHYVQLDTIKLYRENENNFFKSNLKIFSKDFSNNRNIEILTYSSYQKSDIINPMRMNKIVNSINMFIQRGNDIFTLEETSFQIESLTNTVSTGQLIDHINSLKFHFYSNDNSRVGKDNHFWNEIHIENLPKNRYLMFLFLDILDRSDFFERIKLLEEKIVIIYNGHNHFSPSEGKKDIGFNLEKANEIKDILKINIQGLFEQISYVNESLKKQVL